MEVIGACGICNNLSLNVYEIDGDSATVGFSNNMELKKIVEIDSFEDEDWEIKGLEDNYNLGFKFCGVVYFIDEIMRV